MFEDLFSVTKSSDGVAVQPSLRDGEFLWAHTVGRNPWLPSVFATRTGARRRLGAEGIQFLDEGAELLGVGDADFELVVRQAAVEFFDGVEVGWIVDGDA